MVISEKGKTFDALPLNEKTLLGNVNVLWRNKLYKTGNRKHTSVELFQDDVFVRTVSTKHIYLCVVQNIIMDFSSF